MVPSNRLTTVAGIGLVAVIAVAVKPTWGQSCPNSVGPDVIVGDVANTAATGHPPNIENYTATGGIDAFAFGTTSCNIGTVRLNWFADPNANHPVIGQNLFRLKQVSGSMRFEQVGQSWLKHGFAALSENVCCTCVDPVPGMAQLGVGCSDPYRANLNGRQDNAGPKWQVNATRGLHAHPIPNPSGGTATSVSRRLQLRLTDLEVSDGTGPLTATRYFAEGQYVARDDAEAGNKNNNASYRLVAVSGGPADYTFTETGSTQRMKAAVQAWKDTDPTVTITSVVTPEDANANPNLTNAMVLIAAQATDLGGGTWHYEYAVQNLNSDRSIKAFSVPASGYGAVSNIGFHDIEYHSGDGYNSTSTPINYDGSDWPGVFAGGTVTWTMPVAAPPENSNALRWGTVYNFRFDCNLPPDAMTGNVTLVQYKTVNNVVAQTVRPQAVTCLAGDVNLDGLVDGLDVARFAQLLIDGGGTATERCAGDRELPPDYSIDTDDIDGFSNCLLAAGC